MWDLSSLIKNGACAPLSGTCCCSVAQSYPTLPNPLDCSTLGFPVPHCPYPWSWPTLGFPIPHCPYPWSWPTLGFPIPHYPYPWSWPKFMSIELGMPSNCLCPLLLLPSIFPSIRVFSKESAVRWPKHWNFSFSINPSKEYSRLISFRINWFYLLAFQGTLKSLLQHHNLKVSFLQCSAFFIVQLSRSYMTTGKTGSAET